MWFPVSVSGRMDGGLGGVRGYAFFFCKREKKQKEGDKRQKRSACSETRCNRTYMDSALVHQNLSSAGETLIG